MKRKIAMLCSVVMLTSCFAACGNAKVQESPPTLEPIQEAPEKEVAIEHTETPPMLGYNLLWADEFDGPTLDESNWNVELRDPGWTNNELQAYVDTDENVFIKDGCLCLKAIETVDENGKKSYTSGKVNSQNKRDFLYGKVVVRAKVPEGQGLWPAAWMMPTDESKYGQWPKCGEIDIMEVLGNDTKTSYGTIHYGEPHGQEQGKKELTEGSFSDDFHEFSVEWEPGI